MIFDSGAIATYLGLLGTAFLFLMGSVYKMGSLAKTFDSHVKKITEWEGAMQNLNAIPDLKTGITVLSAKIQQHEDRTLARFEKHQSDISQLRSTVSLLQGRVGLDSLKRDIDKG